MRRTPVINEAEALHQIGEARVIQYAAHARVPKDRGPKIVRFDASDIESEAPQPRSAARAPRSEPCRSHGVIVRSRQPADPHFAASDRTRNARSRNRAVGPRLRSPDSGPGSVTVRPSFAKTSDTCRVSNGAERLSFEKDVLSVRHTCLDGLDVRRICIRRSFAASHVRHHLPRRRRAGLGHVTPRAHDRHGRSAERQSFVRAEQRRQRPQKASKLTHPSAHYPRQSNPATKM